MSPWIPDALEAIHRRGDEKQRAGDTHVVGDAADNHSKPLPAWWKQLLKKEAVGKSLGKMLRGRDGDKAQYMHNIYIYI